MIINYLWYPISEDPRALIKAYRCMHSSHSETCTLTHTHTHSHAHTCMHAHTQHKVPNCCVSCFQKSTESLADMHTTGIAMLFSAGTFLYVATVHVLPEISTVQHRHTMADGTVVIRESKGFKNFELLALVTGAIVPVLLALGHKHWSGSFVCVCVLGGGGLRIWKMYRMMIVLQTGFI